MSLDLASLALSSPSSFTCRALAKDTEQDVVPASSSSGSGEESPLQSTGEGWRRGRVQRGQLRLKGVARGLSGGGDSQRGAED